jgi:hypothetical protein
VHRTGKQARNAQPLPIESAPRFGRLVKKTTPSQLNDGPQHKERLRTTDPDLSDDVCKVGVGFLIYKLPVVSSG